MARTPTLQDFTLRQLEYVVAVADALGFRRAAERCHVSQPALSAQVRQVEEALGVQLFERDQRRVLLTPAGEQVVARARRVLVEAADLLALARGLAEPLSGPLRLGVIPTVAPYVLPEVVPALARAWPRLRLLIREETTEQVVRGLEEGRLEVGLLALEAELRGLESEVIAQDPFVLATPPDHPLAKRRSLRPDDLLGTQVLLLDDGHCFRRQALALCARGGAGEADFRATSLTTLAQMVASGAGVTLLPQLAVQAENRAGQLATVAFAQPAPFRTLALVWRPGYPGAPALRRLAATLREAW
jgi:LysR family transcriptional regulator, hydrogen peroxide-inducible genes activator